MRLLWIASLYAFHVSTKTSNSNSNFNFKCAMCFKSNTNRFNNQKIRFVQLYFYKCWAYMRTCYNKAKHIGKNKLVVNEIHREASSNLKL